MLTEEIQVDVFTEARLPLQERVVDKLADVMFASDMIVDLLKDDRSLEARRLQPIAIEVKQIYDRVNALMHRLTD